MGTNIIIFFFFVCVNCILAVPTSQPDRRIVGGHDIPIEDVPYQVSRATGGSHSCGGSIIAPNYIVTAAHCTHGETPEDVFIRAGTSTRDSGGLVVNVKNIYNHPKYDRNTVDYDLAVLELADSLEFNDQIATIGLPSRTQHWPPGTEVLVSGWGLLHMGDTSLPVNLQGVTIQLIDQDTCVKDYGSITERMFCAGVDGGGKDSCTYDSGGPLQVDGVLAGVVSFGAGCAVAHFPGVYANVSVLLDFIEEVTEL